MTGARPVLEAPLPARWGAGQRLKNGFIYVVVRVAFAVVRWTPLVLARPGARLLGWLAWWVAGGERRKSLRHLAVAFPELAERNRRRLGRACFVHLALSGVEAAHVDRLARRIELSAAQREIFAAALAEGRGVVAFTGHIGNWELLAQVVAARYPLTTFAKPLYDPRLTRWVHRLRSAGGLEVIWRGDEGVSRQMHQVFDDQRILAALIDQDTDVQNVFVPFFGRPAATPSAPAALALRQRAPVIVAWSHRRGRVHELHVERLELPDSGDRDADAVELTARASAALERGIRQAPEQWVWMHARWRRRPQD